MPRPRRHAEVVKTTVLLPSDLMVELKHHCADTGQTQTFFIEQSLRDRLNNRGRGRTAVDRRPKTLAGSG